MIRCIFTFLVVCLMSSDLSAQANRHGLSAESDARSRRAYREKAFSHAGEHSRAFVESDYAEIASQALLKCSKENAAALADFYNSGGLSRIAEPSELLRAIAQEKDADEIARWAIDHVNELTDKYYLRAYLSQPFEYILGLKKLATSAAELRALDTPGAAQKPESEKHNAAEVERPRWSLNSLNQSDREGLAAAGVFAGVIGLVVWRRRRAMRDAPA